MAFCAMILGTALSLVAAGLLPEIAGVGAEQPLAQCKKESYAFCCGVGTACDCTKGMFAKGQCKKESYSFCCLVGNKCDCTQPPPVESNNFTAPSLPALGAPQSVEEAAVAATAADVQWPLAQCKKESYAFCCGVGTACDCNKGIFAKGQCKKESYSFCCLVGTKCDCSKPPQQGNSAVELVPRMVEAANVDSVERAAQQPLVQCKKESYAFCCGVGTACDCKKGMFAKGQCKKESYSFCCLVGNKCDCTQPPPVESSNSTTPSLLALDAPHGAEEVAMSVAVTALDVQRQCKKESYAFCCGVGTACDCKKGMFAKGQCKKESYSICCLVGNKCDCTQPPPAESSNVTTLVI